MVQKRKRNLLDSSVQTSTTPVCILDGDRRLRFFSSGMTALTGWSPDQLEGLICDPAAGVDGGPAELLLAAIAPTADVMAGKPECVTTLLPVKGSSGIRTSVTFLPLLDEDRSVLRILVHCEQSPGHTTTTGSLTQKLHAEVTALRFEFRRSFSGGTFLGACPAIQRALAQAELLRDARASFEISGPSGSGRRHLARLIHVSGSRHEPSCVILDCVLLTAEQVLQAMQHLQRLLREHSGAAHQRVGTLVLQNAERCPREVQKWILDGLWTEREGIRMVAVTERSLNQASDDEVLDEFRELFRSVEIQLPALRYRGDDISLLAQAFIEDCRRQLETSAEGMSEEFERELQRYRWPGNVHELRSVITEACQSSFQDRLTLDDLPFSFRTGVEAQELPHAPDAAAVSLEELMKQFEVDVLNRTLEACGGNKAEAARRLGMTRPRLYRRLKTLGLSDDD